MARQRARPLRESWPPRDLSLSGLKADAPLSTDLSRRGLLRGQVGSLPPLSSGVFVGKAWPCGKEEQGFTWSGEAWVKFRLSYLTHTTRERHVVYSCPAAPNLPGMAEQGGWWQAGTEKAEGLGLQLPPENPRPLLASPHSSHRAFFSGRPLGSCPSLSVQTGEMRVQRTETRRETETGQGGGSRVMEPEEGAREKPPEGAWAGALEGGAARAPGPCARPRTRVLTFRGPPHPCGWFWVCV